MINGAVASFEPVAAAEDNSGHNAPSSAIITEAGDTITVMVQGNSLLVEAAGSTITMAYGAESTFAGKSISMPLSSGAKVVEVNGKPLTLQGASGEGSNEAAASQTQFAAVITQDGKTYTAGLQGGSTLVLKAAGTTLTVPRGAAVTLGDDIFSMPTVGSTLVHDGITATLTPTVLPANPSDTVAVLSHDGQSLSAIHIGDSIVVAASGSTITLADGTQTTVGYDTISAALTGGAAVVVNGTSTLVMSTQTDATKSSVSSNGEAEATAEAEPGKESAAWSDSSLAWMSLLLAVGGCIFVGWL